MFINLECVICYTPYDNSFYDKGDQGRCDNGGTRYLCSIKCRDILMQKSFDAIKLDNEQKIAQRKRCLEHYYKNKEYWRTYQNKRYAKQTGLAGAI